MPVLPLHEDERWALVHGIMHFPQDTEVERVKAGAIASKILAGASKVAGEHSRTFSPDLNRRIVRLDGGTVIPTKELRQREKDGEIIGELVRNYFALARQRREVASWEHANQALQITRNASSRSSYMAAKARLLPAAHLWGAWVLRGMRLKPQPDIGYDMDADFETFIQEAEALLDWGVKWLQSRNTAEPPFPAEIMWRAPEGWSRSIPWRVGWPTIWDTLEYDLPKELLDQLLPSGRPKKSSR